MNADAHLKVKAPDYVATAAKAVLGAVPFVGSLLSEIAGTIIPNQRVDRIAKFANILQEKLSKVEKGLIRAQLSDENFTDLLEESIRQAARSITDERRAYIASLLAHGVSAEDVEFIESKHLLRILGEINDVEVLWLRFHLVPTIGGDKEFREKHSEVFHVPPAFIGGPREIVDKNALKDSYLHHLFQLGLLAPVYYRDMHTKQPQIDSFTGAPKLSHYRITSLGGLLLRHIGFADPRTA